MLGAATRVNMGFIAKADDKATVALSHERLADAAEVEQMRAFWRERIAMLKALLDQSWLAASSRP